METTPAGNCSNTGTNVSAILQTALKLLTKGETENI